ncbi:MAG: 16S rRNA (guanine(966)-N(2))-methyltransferase RsmD [Oscillospiraceae bacterium]|nr:16S rRNA (guanine(966)-N(2))-methyltransferase RsmD [Oscillospiraceae bacterium]
MRVITGSARGVVLESLPGNDVRPTIDRVKEAVFSIIQFEIEGRRVLDLFAGSGQLGIEALSRGAEHAVFIDSDRDAVQVIRRNLEKTKLSDKATLLQTDALSYLRTGKAKFDAAFLDPPFNRGFLEKVLPLLAPLMNAGGVIVCESPFEEKLLEEAGGYKLHREYKYGKTKITVYRDTAENTAEGGVVL